MFSKLDLCCLVVHSCLVLAFVLFCIFSLFYSYSNLRLMTNKPRYCFYFGHLLEGSNFKYYYEILLDVISKIKQLIRYLYVRTSRNTGTKI